MCENALTDDTGNMDNLVMSRRKAIEDYRKGLVKQYEVIERLKKNKVW